ncbi:endolytic transglycosylase MltG [Lentilactobacillus laojiaonis]|uniref:endolytic transglycosylase MltG n=1 Tax=Lentilactobacillus laojiaonis TaxID=2883998 RepID=UPI001D0A0A3D|nr:endolytic transglycosylase MltG [Lentilactobacillus laojiaonis]UDM32611.1 endolytic transglycosylase MltG [Lentilactobacillus laojiaonis]
MDEKQPKKEKSLGKKIIIWVISLLIILIASLGLLGYHYFNESLKPLNPKDNNVKQIHIPLGATNKQIGSILQNNHIVKSGMVFDYYINSHNVTKFKAGYYQLKPSMSLGTIANKLEKGGSDEPIQASKKDVLIREGANIDQIAKEIDKNTDFSKNDFIKLMNDKSYINRLAKTYPKLLSSAVKAKDVRYVLEGYLYPATYEVKKNMPLTLLVEDMVAKTNQVLTPYYDKIKKEKLSVQEFMTLASLIEREGVDQKDREIMAGVLLNRVDIKMPLQSDVAVLYAIHRNDKVLTMSDLKTDSPYNLYTNAGFGPGPFDNPSVSAIKAVLNPRDRSKKYLYFVANTKTRKVYYAKTFDQHQANIGRYAVGNNDNQ